MHVGNLTSLLDGNHKLTRWRMVIHGAIDGFSHLIVYLMCSNNSKASTVLGCYKEAVTMYGVPKRVRMDKSGENVSVARFMLEKRGIDSNPVITGSLEISHPAVLSPVLLYGRYRYSQPP